VYSRSAFKSVSYFAIGPKKFTYETLTLNGNSFDDNGSGHYLDLKTSTPKTKGLAVLKPLQCIDIEKVLFMYVNPFFGNEIKTRKLAITYR